MSVSAANLFGDGTVFTAASGGETSTSDISTTNWTTSALAGSTSSSFSAASPYSAVAFNWVSFNTIPFSLVADGKSGGGLVRGDARFLFGAADTFSGGLFADADADTISTETASTHGSDVDSPDDQANSAAAAVDLGRFASDRPKTIYSKNIFLGGTSIAGRLSPLSWITAYDNNAILGDTFGTLTIGVDADFPFLSASGTNLYWDGTDTTADADGGSGTWDTSSTNWSTAATAGSASAWTNANNDIAVFGGAAGTVTLGADITVGGLQFDTAGYTVAGPNTLTFGTAGTIVANADATISAVIADNAGTHITKTGSGTLTLSGNNTYTGGTTISAGTLATGVAGGLGVGTGTTTIASGANLNLTGGGLTYTGLSTVAGAGTINVTLGTGTSGATLNGEFTSFTGVLNVGIGAVAGAGKFQVTSSTSSRDNSAMTINVLPNATLFAAGAFIANSAPWLASVVLYGGDTGESLGQIRVDYLANWAGDITLAGTITGIDDGFIGCGGTGGTISGVISETGGPRVLSKAGGGTLTLSGANTYSGATEIYGTLKVDSLNSVSTNVGLGTTHTASSNLGAPVTVEDGTISLGKTTKVGNLTYTGSGETTDRVLNLAGTTGGGTLTQSGTGLLKFTSSLTATGVGAKLLTLQGSTAGTGELVGVIVDSSSGATSLTKAGTGTWLLSGANTYTGATTVSAGTLTAGSSSAFGNNPALTLANTAGAILNLNNFNTTLFSLAGGGGNGGNVSLGSATLTVAGNAATTYSGVISGTGGLIQLGSGTLTLSGSNTYTGGTTISSGTLATGVVGGLGTGTTTTIATGASLNLTGGGVTYTGLSTVAGAGTINVTLGTGTSATNLSGDFTSFTGVLNVGVGAAAGAGKVVMNSTGSPDNSAMTINVLPHATLNVTNNSTHQAALVLNGGDTGETIGQLRLTTVSGADTTWSGGLTLAGTITGIGDGFIGSQNSGTISGVISETGGPRVLSMVGGGTITLSGANTYTGATEITGTLKVSSLNSVTTDAGLGTTHTASSNLGAPVTVEDGKISLGKTTSVGKLTYTGSGETTDRVLNLAGTTGGGTLDQSGTGLLKFTSSLTATGVGAKLLTLQGSTAGTGELVGVIGNSSSGATSLTKAGTGTWTLSGANTYTGATTVSAGTLTAGSTSAFGNNSALTLANTAGATLNLNSFNTTLFSLAGGGGTGGNVSLGSATLTLAGNANTTYAGVISGTGGLEKTGLGTLLLTGINTYTGATAVSAGAIGSTGSTARIAGAVTLSDTGGINLATGATGTFTLGSTLALTGAAGAHRLTFDLGNGNNTSDKLVVTSGAPTVTNNGAAVIGFNQIGQSTGGRVNAGIKTLIQAAAAPTLAHYTLATTAAFGSTFVLSVSGNNLQVTSAQAATGPAAAFWSGASDTNWSTAGNWNTDATAGTLTGAVPSYQTNVTFATTTPGATNLTTNLVDTDRDINSLTFAAATGGVTIGGTKMLTLEATNANGNTAGNGITSNNTSGTNTITANIGLASSQTWTVATGGNLEVSSTISDFGSGYALTKAGLGTLTLSGANTYTGTTTVSAGELALNTTAGQALTGNLTVNGGTAKLMQSSQLATGKNLVVSSGTFDLQGFDQTLTNVQLTGGTITGTTGVLTNTNTYDLQAGTVSAILGGSVGATKTTSGTVTLSAANTYTGLTTVSAGVIDVQNASALGATTTGTRVASGAALQLQGGITVGSEALTLSGTGIASGGALRSISGNNTFGGLINLLAATRINSDTSGDTLTLSNTGTLTGSALSLTVGGSGNTVFSGILGMDSGGLTKDGTGTLTLNSANTFTGTTTVSAGALLIGSSASLASGNALTVGASGSADFANVGQTLGAVSNANTATNALNFSATTGTVTLASLSGAGNTRFGSDGVVTGGVATGTVTSVGNFNANISGGSTTATVGGLLTGNITGGTVNAGSLSATTVSSGTNTISGAAGITTLSGGTTTVGGVATIGTLSAGTVNLNGATSDITTLSGGTTTVGGVATIGTLSGGTANLNGATSAVTTLSGGTVNLGSSTTLTVSDGTNAGTINGTDGALTKISTGTLTLSGSNTFTGATTVSAGALNIQHASALGTIDSGTSVASGAALQLQGGITVGAEALTLSGTGVAGDGALRNISGNNTFGGPLSLGASTRINSDTSGSTLTLSDTGTLTGSGFDLTFGGAGNTAVQSIIATGTGNLIKDGSGTLTLGNANTYTGVTTISAGTLALNAGSSAALANTASVSIGSGGTVSLGAASQINAAATLALDGGTLALNGFSQTFDTLDLNAASLIYLNGTAALSFADSSALDWNASTLTLVNFAVADNTLRFGTSAADLSVTNLGLIRFYDFGNESARIDADGYLVPLSTNYINSGSLDLVVAAPITGTTTVTQSGSAITTLTGVNTSTGLASVTASTLVIGTNAGGNWAGDATVSGTGILKGIGTIGGAVIVNTGGNYSPGNSPGIQNVGTLTHNSGSLLTIELDGPSAGNGAGFHDHIISAGAVTLNGGTLSGATIFSGSTGYVPTLGAYHSIITGSAITGTFDAYTFATGDNPTGITFMPDYTATTLSLVAVPTHFGTAVAGLNANQIQIGTALDSFRPTVIDHRAALNPTATLFNGLLTSMRDQQGAAGLSLAYNQLTPEKLTALAAATFQTASLLNSTLQQRSEELRRQGPASVSFNGAVRPASVDDVTPEIVIEDGVRHTILKPNPKRRYGYFASAVGAFSDVEGAADRLGSSALTSAAAAGLDYALNDHASVGLVVGQYFADTDFSLDAGSARTTTNRVAVFHDYHTNGFFVNSSASVGWSNYEVKRKLAFLSETATGDTQGVSFGGQVAAGYDFKLGDFILGPTAAVAYDQTQIDGFDETGSAASLNVREQTAESLTSHLGFHVSRPFVWRNIGWIPDVRLGASHQFFNPNSITARFAAGGNAFTVKPQETGSSYFNPGASLQAILANGLTVRLSYDAIINASYVEHRLNVGVNAEF